jgi:hypothetical protein
MLGGRYELGSVRHELAVGSIHQARDTKGGGRVEVLRVVPRVFASPLEMERARRELRQVQKADDPHLVEVLDHGKADDGSLYVVMEALSGEPLSAAVERARLDEGRARQVLADVVSALASAQRVGVIHRDLAPHNVMLLPDGSVKLRLCGVAAKITDQIHGTPEFISPEQAAGRPVDQRSNVYSLGVLLFYVLVGRPPFVGDADAVLAKHQEDQAPVKELDGATSGMIALVTKALEKLPSRRHLTLRQLSREIDALEAPRRPAAARPALGTLTTPVHGVTALTGGKRPPSSEMPKVSAVDEGTAPTLPPGEVPIPLVQPRVPGQSAAAAPAAAPVQPQPAASTSASGGNTIAGETAEGARVAMRQGTEPPAGARPAVPPPVGQEGQPVGFRETMWFFRGEVESAMAESGDTAAPAEEETAHPDELTEKYADDGSLSDEEASRLSLRTGKTQDMKPPEVAKTFLPGTKMRADEFIGEINAGRKIAVGVAVAGAVVLIGGILWLIFR